MPERQTNNHVWPSTEDAVAACGSCGDRISPIRTADGWYWCHIASRRFACDGTWSTHANYNGTTRVTDLNMVYGTTRATDLADKE